MNTALTYLHQDDFKQQASTIDSRTSYKIKFKTEICKAWTDHGFCLYGMECAFAHGEHELRDKATLTKKYKTKNCTKFTQYGFCKYGSRCQFSHAIPKRKKTTVVHFERKVSYLEELNKLAETGDLDHLQSNYSIQMNKPKVLRELCQL